MTDSFLVTLDSKRYRAKPSDKEIAYITTRMKSAGGIEVTPAELCEHVRNGGTWVPGVFKTGATDESGKTIWGEFVSLQLVGLDFDNDAKVFRRFIDASGEPDYQPVKDADGHELKRQLMPHEAGYLDPTDALDRCTGLGLSPLMLYFTFSASCPDKVKYRLIIDLGEPIADEADASAIVESLMAAFPECDASCSNLNRLFFGTRPNGEVWECWKTWEAES